MTIRNTLAATALMLTTTFSGIASAKISTGSLGLDVQSAAGSGHVAVTLANGVATLRGGVDSHIEANAAEMAAASFPGVEEVINPISMSN